MGWDQQQIIDFTFFLSLIIYFEKYPCPWISNGDPLTQKSWMCWVNTSILLMITKISNHYPAFSIHKYIWISKGKY